VKDNLTRISGQIDLIEKVFSLFTNKEWENNRTTFEKHSEFFSLCLFSLQELKEEKKDLREKEKDLREKEKDLRKENLLLKTENILLQKNLLKQETKKTAASKGKNHA
jgi:hypothetical protein